MSSERLDKMSYRLLAVFNEGVIPRLVICHYSFVITWVCRMRVKRNLTTFSKCNGKSCNILKCVALIFAETARPPSGLEHMYSQHMSHHYDQEEVKAMEVRILQLKRPLRQWMGGHSDHAPLLTRSRRNIFAFATKYLRTHDMSWLVRYIPRL